ncbi:MAG: saccharopine dehydrogenase family protein [Candidatus Hodarchaeota archaeon]
MKILALGGCGDMGRMAIAILLEHPKITSITLADKNYELAKRIVDLINSEKLSPFQIDVTEKEKLIELMSKHDVIVSTVGPYYKFGKYIVEAVIEVKKPYLDICDDWDATQEILELDDKVKAAGIPVVIGIGESPGVTNLLAIYACSKLEEVDDVIAAWGVAFGIKAGKKPKYYIKPEKLREDVGPPSGAGIAAVMHFLYEAIGKIPTYKDGKMIEIEALSEIEPLKIPGYKEVYACHLGHPEPVTLPRTIKANTIASVMFLGETATEVTRSYCQKIINKELTIQEAAFSLNKEFEELEEKAFQGQPPLEELLGGPPTPCVIATGIKNGKRKKIAVTLVPQPFGEMAGMTGIPLAIGTIMLIEGKTKKKVGVLTPEETYEPEEFFDKLAPFCGRKLTSFKDILVEKEEEI